MSGGEHEATGGAAEDDAEVAELLAEYDGLLREDGGRAATLAALLAELGALLPSPGRRADAARLRLRAANRLARDLARVEREAAAAAERREAALRAFSAFDRVLVKLREREVALIAASNQQEARRAAAEALGWSESATAKAIRAAIEQRRQQVAGSALHLAMTMLNGSGAPLHEIEQAAATVAQGRTDETLIGIAACALEAATRAGIRSQEAAAEIAACFSGRVIVAPRAAPQEVTADTVQTWRERLRRTMGKSERRKVWDGFAAWMRAPTWPHLPVMRPAGVAQPTSMPDRCPWWLRIELDVMRWRMGEPMSRRSQAAATLTPDQPPARTIYDATLRALRHQARAAVRG